MNEAFDQLMQFRTTSTHDDTILRSTSILDSLSHGYATLLIVRANAFFNKGKLSEAIEDALKAIEFEPESAGGYLTAGNIYTIQGKLQAAIAIYENGLCSVLPSEWPLLYEKRKEVETKLDRKIDFVSRLPVEIATCIFAQLLDEDDSLTLCASISKYWRECILNRSPELWRTVNIVNNTFNSPRPEPPLLFSVSSHVHHLVLNDASERNLHILIDMAENNKFSSVKDIEIVTLSRLIKQHMAFVTPLRKSVTHLSIMLMNHEPDDNQTAFELDSIMSLCPNLEYLYLQTRTSVEYHPSPQDQYPLLGLTIKAPRLNRGVLEHLIPLCPKLEVLDVYDLTPGTISLLYQQCSRLRHLVVVDGYHLTGMNSTAGKERSITGLTSIRYTKGNTIIRHLMPFLNRSKNSLRTLELKIRDLDEGVNQLAHIGFSQLTKLHLHMDGNHLPAAASMIHRCPVLEDVILGFGGATVTDDFFATLVVLPRLRKLTLSYISSSSAELRRLFAHFANPYRGCTLRAIILKDCNGVTDGVLRTLADITTLREIVLHYLHGTTADNIATFIQKLKTLPYLETVVLDAMSQITDDMVVQLAGIDGLQRLDLKCINRITSAGIRALADHVCTIRDVSIFGCHGVDSEAQQYLKEKLLCQ